jgi:predicted trehalose synthase
MAAAYRTPPTVRFAADDVTDQAAETGSDVQPASTEWLGAMRDVGEIVGDIVSPAADSSDWAALGAENAERDDARTP